MKFPNLQRKPSGVITWQDLINANNNGFYLGTKVNEAFGGLTGKEILNKLIVGMSNEKLMEFINYTVVKIIEEAEGNEGKIEAYMHIGVPSALARDEGVEAFPVILVIALFVENYEVKNKANVRVHFNTVFSLMTNEEIEVYNEETGSNLLIIREKATLQ